MESCTSDNIKIGQRVSAKWIDTKYYEAVVISKNEETFKVRFIEDNIEYETKKHLVKPLQLKKPKKNCGRKPILLVKNASDNACPQTQCKENVIITNRTGRNENETFHTTATRDSLAQIAEGKNVESSLNKELDWQKLASEAQDLSDYDFSSSSSEYKLDTESESYSDSDDDTMTKHGKRNGNMSKVLDNKRHVLPDSMPESQGITVCSTTNENDERHYDKKYFCFFCENLFSKLPRHLESMHSEESEVAQIIALKTDRSKEGQTRRKNLLTKLRNLGSHKWNCNVLKAGKGKLLVIYRPKNDLTADPYKYTPCPTCYGYYSKNELWRHECPLNENRKKHSRLISDSRNLLPMPVNDENVKSILVSMRQDIIARTAKNDFTICEFIRRMFSAKGGDQSHKKCEIRNNAREVARLLLVLRKGSNKNAYTLEDFFNASHYKEIIKGVQKVAAFNEKTKEYEAPELARKLGLHIKTCATLALAKAIEENNKCKLERFEQFIKLHKINYFVEVAAQARRNRNKKQRSKQKLLPLSHDVVLLTNHINAIAEKSITFLQSKDNSLEEIKSSFVNLQKSTLAKIILFNRRREGEVSRMTVQDYKNKKETNEVSDLAETLSDTEKALCRILTRIEIQGKGDRNVPVLLTQKMKDGIELCLDFREVVGVAESNNFLFASCNYGSKFYYRGSDCLRAFSKECGAENPKALRSTKLRKQVASLSQILNLKNNELDSLANFLGHDIRIHREFYRLPDSVVQVAKLSKIFLALERGKLHHEAGKSLDEIEVSVEENALEEYHENSLDQNLEITSDIDQGSTSTSNIPSVRPKIGGYGCCRRKWSAEEKAAVDRHLSGHILREKLPGAAEAKRCIAAEPVLANRSWRNVKDFCRNQILAKTKRNK